MKNQIVLASQSPRRKELLSYIVKEFEIYPSNVDETIEPGTTPEDAVRGLSLKKASFVAQNFPNSLVIGSDTVVVFGNKIIGKAESIDEARETLQSMSGQEHFVFTDLINAFKEQCIFSTEIRCDRGVCHSSSFITNHNFWQIIKKLDRAINRI